MRRENCIHDRGYSALAQVLPVSQLEELDLSCNPARNEGASALASALKTNSPLRVLRLRKCFILHEGGMTLANCLRYNSNLEELDLSENRIDLPGIVTFTMALEEDNVTPRKLASYSAGSSDMQFM